MPIYDDKDENDKLKHPEKKLKIERNLPFQDEMTHKRQDTQKREELEPEDLKPKSKNKDAKASPNAPLMPCIKCKKTHRKGQCKGY